MLTDCSTGSNGPVWGRCVVHSGQLDRGGERECRERTRAKLVR